MTPPQSSGSPPAATTDARERFLAQVAQAVQAGTLRKLTLGKYRGPEKDLRNLFVRPVALKDGSRLSFLWRYATRDITKNHPPAEALPLLRPLLGGDFLDAHLFTADETLQLQGTSAAGPFRLRRMAAETTAESATDDSHDRTKQLPIPTTTPWLRDLGIIDADGKPRQGQSGKFRQINRFVEILAPLFEEAFPSGSAGPSQAPLRIVDMGSGKGYLTFALAHFLGDRAEIRGIEQRPELVDLGNRTATRHGLYPRLGFETGTIESFSIPSPQSALRHPDILIALHACDTATDDAIAHGIRAGARLIVVAPCCQKELRPRLVAPPVLAPALRHGIFEERQAEFVTDALRTLLLEASGYRTRAFEFISSEHTAKNLMITAVRPPGARPGEPTAAREFARFYGIRRQRLADRLGIDLIT